MDRPDRRSRSSIRKVGAARAPACSSRCDPQTVARPACAILRANQSVPGSRAQPRRALVRRRSGQYSTRRSRRHGRAGRHPDRSARPRRGHRGKSERSAADRRRQARPPSKRQPAQAAASPARSARSVGIFAVAGASASPGQNLDGKATNCRGHSGLELTRIKLRRGVALPFG